MEEDRIFDSTFNVQVHSEGVFTSRMYHGQRRGSEQAEHHCRCCSCCACFQRVGEEVPAEEIAYDPPVNIFYTVVGPGELATGRSTIESDRPHSAPELGLEAGLPPVVMIMGLGAEHKAWIFQARKLCQTRLVLLLDNRGIGRSDVPKEEDAYTTDFMARDVLAILDHLRWRMKVHVVGFSMGGMIAMKIVTIAPERIASLCVISSSRGGWDLVPTLSGIRLLMKAARARTPEERATMNLTMHYSRSFLTQDPEKYQMLFQEYLEYARTHMDTEGSRAQLNAALRHNISRADYRRIRYSPFPKLVAHGRNDRVLTYRSGRALAKLIDADFCVTEAAHFAVREDAGKINAKLGELFAKAEARGAVEQVVATE